MIVEGATFEATERDDAGAVELTLVVEVVVIGDDEPSFSLFAKILIVGSGAEKCSTPVSTRMPSLDGVTFAVAFAPDTVN